MPIGGSTGSEETGPGVIGLMRRCLNWSCVSSNVAAVNG